MRCADFRRKSTARAFPSSAKMFLRHSAVRNSLIYFFRRRKTRSHSSSFFRALLLLFSAGILTPRLSSPRSQSMSASAFWKNGVPERHFVFLRHRKKNFPRSSARTGKLRFRRTNSFRETFLLLKWDKRSAPTRALLRRATFQ